MPANEAPPRLGRVGFSSYCEGELQESYKALSGITSACVGCHAGYRIR